MTLRDQVLAQSLLLAGELTEQQAQVLGALCTAATASLEARLRDGIQAEDCKADFIAAASLLSLAAMNGVTSENSTEQIAVADFSVKNSKNYSDAASNCLRAQAELLISPYLKDRFSFRGV